MTSEVCLNCDAPLHGPYCSKCGQKTGQHLDVHGFVHEAAHEFLHLDGKILRSLHLLLLRPGQLTREFLAGRRARYVTPLRLYLTFSVLFFALAAIFPSATEGMIKVGPTEPRAPGIKVQESRPAPSRVEKAASKAEREADRIGAGVQKDLPRAMFVLMPLFALLCWGLFRKQERHYIAHLYYAIHFHAFVFALLTIHVLLSAAGLKPLGAVLLMTTIPYHYIALHRVFAPTRAALLTKGTILGFVYWLSTMLAIIGIALAFYI
jgi:hypothetical protein